MKTSRLITAKLLIFLAGALVVFSLLIWRLADLQLLRGSDFVALADANRLFTERQAMERGVFLDRYGQPLVVNTPQYFQLENPSALYSDQQPIAREAALKQLATQSSKVGYDLERLYLYPRSTAHVLGYTGSVNAEELEEDNRLHIEDNVGKLGLELQFDEVVRGLAGTKLYEINAQGEKQRQVGEREGVAGLNVHTTIDPYLSRVAYEAMGDKRGAVVIMDATTGEVLTLVSTPTFDPTVLSTQYIDEAKERKRREQLSDFFSNPQQLFFNRAISGTYPPGSVFKLVTALAGLEEDAVDAETIVEDTGVLEVGQYSYANWYYSQYGRIDGPISLVRAIARSNDIYFYKAAEWTGPQSLADMARLFGFGEPTGIEVPGEAAGLVPDPAWKERELGERWFLGNTFHLGIGQGNLLVSPLQIAQLLQTIARQGTQCQPQLVRDNPLQVNPEEENQCAELGIPREDLNLVVTGMLEACSAGGTGFPFFDHNAAFRQPELSAYEEISQGAVACKTGTSEFGAADDQGFRKTHGWFAAIVGIDQEQIAGGNVGITTTEAATASATSSTSSATNSAAQDFTTAVTVDASSESFRQRWLQGVAETGFPQELVMVALVESDQANPFREGSSDAAPVVKAIVDWIYGESMDLDQPTEIQPAADDLAE